MALRRVGRCSHDSRGGRGIAVAPAVRDPVVCVLTADGVENYYVGVDLSGLDPDGAVPELQDR
jgi:hypothetical protein